MIEFVNKTVSSFDNTKLNVRLFGDIIKSDKTLIVTHGYGEHQDYYEHLALFFSSNGFLVVTYDLRSHGHSGGRRGDVPQFDYFIEDLERIISEARKIKPDNNIFLLGHSLGGNIVLNFLLNRTDSCISRAVISSPWLKLAFDPPLFKKLLAKIGLLLFPSLVIKGELKIEHLSRDQDFINRFDIDPMTYDKISARYYDGIVKAGLHVLENAKKLKTPVLICHGDDDKVTSYEASRQFANDSGSQFKSFGGGYRHVVFSENDKDEIFNFFLKYLVTL